LNRIHAAATTCLFRRAELVSSPISVSPYRLRCRFSRPGPHPDHPSHCRSSMSSLSPMASSGGNSLHPLSSAGPTSSRSGKWALSLRRDDVRFTRHRGSGSRTGESAPASAFATLETGNHSLPGVLRHDDCAHGAPCLPASEGMRTPQGSVNISRPQVMTPVVTLRSLWR
jgi:hypothetical protein